MGVVGGALSHDFVAGCHTAAGSLLNHTTLGSQAAQHLPSSKLLGLHDGLDGGSRDDLARASAPQTRVCHALCDCPALAEMLITIGPLSMQACLCKVHRIALRDSVHLEGAVPASPAQPGAQLAVRLVPMPSHPAGLHAPQSAHPAAPAQPGVQAGGAAGGTGDEGDARGLGAGQGAFCGAVHRPRGAGEGGEGGACGGAAAAPATPGVLCMSD